MIFEVLEDEVKMDKAWRHEDYGSESSMIILSCWDGCLRHLNCLGQA